MRNARHEKTNHDNDNTDTYNKMKNDDMKMITNTIKKNKTNNKKHKGHEKNSWKNKP